MTVDITTIINAVIALIAAVITAFVIPWVKSKTTSQQREDLIAWIKIAVAAAEQIYIGDKRGAEKKQYVLDFLAKYGFSVNEDSVNAAIEAAVRELNNEGIVIA